METRCGCQCSCHAEEAEPEWPGACAGCCEPGDGCACGRALAEYGGRESEKGQSVVEYSLIGVLVVIVVIVVLSFLGTNVLGLLTDIGSKV